MLSEYREVFLEELEEQLQLMDEEILKLEREENSHGVVQSLFRAAHTLKGSSAAMGFDVMKQLTHEMEQLLDLVRSGKRAVTGALIDRLFHALDHLKLLKLDIVDGGGGTGIDISACVQELHSFANGAEEVRQGVEQAVSPVQPVADKMESAPLRTSSVKPVLLLDTRLKVSECQDQGRQVNWIFVRISSSCPIKGARAFVIQSSLAEWGEVLYTHPELEDMEEHSSEPTEIAYLHAGQRNREELRALTMDLMDVETVRIEPVSTEEIELVQPSPVLSAPKTAGQEDASSPAKTKQQTIRVNVERLEHLMNLVGELVIDQTRIHQVERIQRRRFTDDSVEELGHISDHLSRIIGDLQESVMKTRMLPIEQLFNRFPRMIRDLSRDLGKEIELVIEGKDTELDRTLIEEIADPLIHLIRNAVDHGIEAPGVREAAGKSPKGTLTIRAAHEDNQVVIYVEDDGAGIHAEKVKASAMAKGVITQEEASYLSEPEAVELIFRPGFSMAAVVSDVSGRGVGMDIVKSHIEKLNGLIEIHTVIGKGTTFKIKLPLTLAIIDGLLVKLAGQTYIIPMSNISEIVRVTREDIVTVRGQSVILLRNQVIPVARIHEYFHLPVTEHSKQNISLVIVGSAEKRLALVVDELIGNQEIVIKSLGSYIGKVTGIAGGTILGDGSVALIMEIVGIISKIGGKTVS
ncbi:two-component system chemotaxis sensor kinase CheA [Fontibacillus phaseoli]|uniref:Chemotaxis protein CheA n=1 Tax=Fontibacillus phaseoli TaxID=1416533 RepID=A0A369B3Z3_9BACL|nr:chemotaxis protein CheA [Fontibacillus phaseoli]RCX14434.1 two-component system chemotaxis sensor kinase CheA [Fontibacillus phaseoli]